MELRTQAASGIAGGMNPVAPSPHSCSNQSALPDGASGHSPDSGFASSGTR
jgi:hypothetical protein